MRIEKMCRALSVLIFMSIFAVNSHGQTNLGMVAFTSNHNPGGYLQAHTGDGEMHASNSGRNEEETWFLMEINKQNHTYALANWRTGWFLSRHGGGVSNHRIMANATGIGPAETWRLVKGDGYGRPGSVAFQSVMDNSWMMAYEPRHNASGEGGEVFAEMNAGPASGAGWAGWFYMTSVDKPSPGQDVWNTIGGTIGGIANKITPADIVAVLSAL